MCQNAESSGLVLEMNWSAVTAVTCGGHEIKSSFTAKDMTLEGCAGTERSCLMDEGLARVCYHDNNHQVQPHLHVSKVKNCDFRLGVFKMLSLTRIWGHEFRGYIFHVCPARSAQETAQMSASPQPSKEVTTDQSAQFSS